MTTRCRNWNRETSRPHGESFPLSRTLTIKVRASSESDRVDQGPASGDSGCSKKNSASSRRPHARQRTELKGPAVLDTLNFAIFVLDGERRPVHINARASALLEKGRPFHLDQLGSLRLAEEANDKALRESVAALMRARASGRKRVVPVHGDGRSPAMFAWLSALPARGEIAQTSAPGICVMVTQRSLNTVGREIFTDLFGLTLAESRLAEGLLQGMSPNQYAARQNLSQNTVRNQLKAVFEKTEVRRQSDLVSLICNVLAPVSFDEPAN